MSDTNELRAVKLTKAAELVERLRKRAEDEREIQRNNEAVAAALQGQIEAFKRGDGTHNTFAVRLGLDHQNCAKRDAGFAADWDAAADMIEEITGLAPSTSDARAPSVEEGKHG